ncbi:MAG: HEAT repeat domain-containing protein [Marinospirillum sp.]|uniref:HEAT repeat domain-containing protein n=1 Tax=Marinospirillum sp. TaxID=2183934 RepID=UPI0019FBC774|nr:HEAT repeat domain-containing protein [Marinospirillum sp.]MBE0505176.1 HEAT repeat domain-containing protein [Marinospirillum sp.]
MALVKRTLNAPEALPEQNGASLEQALSAPDVSTRRLAARDLARHPESLALMLQRLVEETDYGVRQAIFCSLQSIGNKEVIAGLIPLLRSDEADLRNAAIEVLQSQPELTGEHLENLLHDADSDVRIFAIDILQLLAHPKAPVWLLQVLEQETHANVLGTALDRLAELGQPEMLPALMQLRPKIHNEPYLLFTLDLVIQRLQAQQE